MGLRKFSDEERKERQKISSKEWYLNHLETSKERSREWAHSHPEARRESSKRYQNKHQKEIKETGEKFRLNHPKYKTEHSNKSNRKNVYKISEEDYANLVSSQNGKCAICGKTDRRALSIDHDHNTGKVRGLLCSSCNTALGLAYDNVDLLEKMIKYLKGE